MYRRIISEATGCTDPAMLARIEQTMRSDIYHSTLDWQTAAELRCAARIAYGLLRIRQRPASRLVLAEDRETARLLGVRPKDVPEIARQAQEGAP